MTPPFTLKIYEGSITSVIVCDIVEARRILKSVRKINPVRDHKGQGRRYNHQRSLGRQGSHRPVSPEAAEPQVDRDPREADQEQEPAERGGADSGGPEPRGPPGHPLQADRLGQRGPLPVHSAQERV